MITLENIRLDKAERKALLSALNSVKDEVFIFGSRLDLDKRGGDIDLLVYSKQNSLNLSMEISRKFFLQCEEKIDVLVVDPGNLSNEQKAFIDTLNLYKIK